MYFLSLSFSVMISLQKVMPVRHVNLLFKLLNDSDLNCITFCKLEHCYFYNGNNKEAQKCGIYILLYLCIAYKKTAQFLMLDILDEIKIIYLTLHHTKWRWVLSPLKSVSLWWYLSKKKNSLIIKFEEDIQINLLFNNR